jgi:hypothetical protein
MMQDALPAADRRMLEILHDFHELSPDGRAILLASLKKNLPELVKVRDQARALEQKKHDLIRQFIKDAVQDLIHDVRATPVPPAPDPIKPLRRRGRPPKRQENQTT